MIIFAPIGADNCYRVVRAFVWVLFVLQFGNLLQTEFEIHIRGPGCAS
jgi:hypothetical protein